jgi:L-glutamine:2-deoxy-scyllo-inosose/3-amino-2,3-dideoxy-scyllo-inosose aminotransferase
MKEKLALLGGTPVGKLDIPAWPIHGQEEIDLLTEVVKSGEWGFLGPKEQELENKFARFCGTRYAVAATNGTHTIRMALEALGIGPGDEVIVPGLTWQATAAAALDVNAVPILTDIDPDTYTMDPKAAEAAVSSRTKALLPVHLYGRICDMDAIMDIAGKHKLAVIEDCAHQHGSVWNNKKVGSIGNAGSFSLQASKVLNAGEGGILTTDDKNLADLFQSLKICGRPIREGAPTIQSGNYRMTEFQAAIALAQLSRLEEQNRKREENARYLETKLKEIDGLSPLKRDSRITFQVYYNWTMKYDRKKWNGVPKDRFIKALLAELEDSVIISGTYEPLHRSPLYRPDSKATHRISEIYRKAIAPDRFELPVCDRVYEEEAVNMLHTGLLGSKKTCDRFIEAVWKIRNNAEALKNSTI